MKRDVAARIISKPERDSFNCPFPLPILEQAAKVLIISSGRRAAMLKELTPNATVVTNIETLESIETGFDAAVIDGTLESDPWDRWTLQCVHRALKMNGALVLVVAPVTSLASVVDLPFVAYASRQVLTQLMRRLGSSFKLRGSVHRRYHLPRLVRKLQLLGYTAVEAGTGWPGSTRSGDSAWFARRSIVTARKACSLAGLRGRPWPDADHHRRRYAEQWAALFAAREQWLSAFPRYRDVTPTALEPSAWRDARVLVLSPHPDDELIGCGGTLLRVLSAGAQVSIVQATDGSKLESLRHRPQARRNSIRLEEATRVAHELGARLVLWRKEDARLQCSNDSIEELARLLSERRPTHVFTPLTTDWHADHRALSRILGEALAVSDVKTQVLQYEVWSLAPANLYCDVTEEAEALEHLLLLYRHAMRAADYVHMCESRNLMRALELTGKPGYVEAFLSTTSAEFCSMAHSD